MAFLTKTELKTVVQIPLVDKIINADNEIVDNIINESIALMTSYLSRYYDTGKVFSQEGGSRNMGIVKRLKDIVIYEIYERHTREQNAVAMRRYNEAMDWLEKLNTGEFGDKTLPSIQGDDDGDNPGTSGDVRFGGNKKYGSIY